MASTPHLQPARLVCQRLASHGDPLLAAGWLRGRPRAVALAGAWCGGGLLLSSDPLYLAPTSEDPFALLDRMPPVSDLQGERVGGGWFGWLGFGLAGEIEALPPPPTRPVPMPRFELAFHDHLVRCDADGRWWFEALWTQARAGFLSARRAWWADRLARPAPSAQTFRAGPLRPVGAGLAGHREAVAETIERIAAGELSQANICLRLAGELAGDPLDLWLHATAAARPGYAAFIASGSGEQTVISLSPELFLERRARQVVTRPIKGTAPADTEPASLAASAKDRAENVMIVDLMRNDLGRVCAYGSIQVEELCRPRRGPGVWQLESTVSGTLRPGIRDSELLRAAFPPGSVTGAPKVQALKTIHALESTAREAYCGAIGLCSPLAGLELNVAIRTLESAGSRLWLGVGGGIVSDSEPAGEVQEALAKARGVLGAAGLHLDAGAVAPTASRPPLTRLSRPDPTAGVFETIGVSGAHAVGLAVHVARLARSAAELGLGVPERLEASVRELAGQLGEGGVRVAVTPGGVTLETRTRPVPGATRLVPVTLPGGLGAHKWADRRLVDAYSSSDSTPLICDLDGTMLEAGYAAVTILSAGRLIAPPWDGRQLPSLSRDRLLEAAARHGVSALIRPISFTELARAEAIILSSSLRGPHLAILGAHTPSPSGRSFLQLLTRAWRELITPRPDGGEPVGDREQRE